MQFNTWRFHLAIASLPSGSEALRNEIWISRDVSANDHDRRRPKPFVSDYSPEG